jgi:hypothetical protein
MRKIRPSASRGSVASVEDSPLVLRVLLAAEPQHCTGQAAQRLIARLDGRRAVVMVVGVAAPPGRFECWAPSSGHIDLEELRVQATQLACVEARRLTALLPPDVEAAYRAVPAWRDLLVEAGRYDVVLLGGPPSRRRDRRLLPAAVLE